MLIRSFYIEWEQFEYKKCCFSYANWPRVGKQILYVRSANPLGAIFEAFAAVIYTDLGWFWGLAVGRAFLAFKNVQTFLKT